MTTKKRGRAFVWTVALGFASLLAAVVVLTQVGFYRDNLGDSTPIGRLPWLDLAYLTPIAVEGVAQVFTVMTSFAVINNRPSARYERLMWLFSSIAAGTNAWHNIHGGDWLTGVVLGGMSIVGPLIVHMALRWDRDAQADRTAEEIRRAAIERAVRASRRAAQVSRHPINSWHTISIATNLGCGWDTAYRIALLGQYKTVKGLLREQFEQSLPNASKAELDAPSKASDTAIEQDLGAIGESLFPACSDPLIEDLHTLQSPGDMLAVWGLHEARQEGRASQESSSDELAQHDRDGLHNKPVQDVESKSTELAQQGEQGLQNKADDGLHEDDEQDDKPLAASRKQASRKASSKPRNKPSSKRVVQAKAERQEHVAARYWHERKAAGEDPRSKPGVEIARELGIGASALSRGFRWAEDGFHPDKNEEQ
ncbi:DUF2637 domain-containing protein [Saccharopolyspora sp. 6T]|uniref:DUF2637 domain-containing protein n=1 Tax=Saccharopolyspora sp. 6T TaxID=2877238 RepID=UPI001CD59D93|nr:DUF2637 domain-containing protein [Saccharopolyspora sp. 6T]MCA1185736.1 DUF2637 domain-containing protein [Saccharopolyspora sp. 6T]